MPLPRRVVMLALAALAALPLNTRPSAAQTAPLARIDLKLSGTAAAPALAGPRLNNGALEFSAASGLQIVVACASPFDCAKLGTDSRDVVASAAAAKSVSFNVPPTAEGQQVEFSLQYDGHPVTPSFALTSAASTAAAAAAETDDALPPLAVRVRQKACANRIDVSDPNAFVLWADGTPISAPARSPVEGEPVTFHVVGDKSALSHLTVKRKSALRAVTISNILGQGVADTSINKLNRMGLRVITCDVVTTTIRDFAAGAAQVEISALDDDGTTHVENTFDFDVNALYTGAYALGAVTTSVASPAFGKTYNGTDTVATTTAGGRHRVLYVLTYTPFVWGRRDVTRPPDNWWQALNPMVGVVLNDISNNAIAGLSYDLGNMLYLTGGVHAARVSTLDANGGAVLGQPFQNRAAEVPTTKRWKSGWFWGVSIDLQGAAGLLKAAVGAAPK